MAMLRTCFTEGCETKTLGTFCLECEAGSDVAEPALAEPARFDRRLTLLSAVTRDLTPAA